MFKTDDRRGFSLIELLVVMAISLVVMAAAIPRFVTFMSTYKLKSAQSNAAGMLQQLRMQAVRQNRTLSLRTSSTSGRAVGYADFNDNSSWDQGSEAAVILPTGITVPSNGAGHPGDATSGLGYTAQTSGLPKFNSRGLPCVVVSGLCRNIDASNNQVGYVIYFQNSAIMNAATWGAITITPAGRIRTWIYTGSGYTSQ